MVVERINVYVTTGSFCGIIVYGETLSHEKPGVIVSHSIVVADSLPIFAVGAPLATCHVAAKAEIRQNLKIDLIGRNLYPLLLHIVNMADDFGIGLEIDHCVVTHKIFLSIFR